MRCIKKVRHDGLGVSLNREKLEEVECFTYLEMDAPANETMVAELSQKCVEEGVSVCKGKTRYVLQYSCPNSVVWMKVLGLTGKDRKRLDLEMKCLGAISGARWVNHVRNDNAIFFMGLFLLKSCAKISSTEMMDSCGVRDSF